MSVADILNVYNKGEIKFKARGIDQKQNGIQMTNCHVFMLYMIFMSGIDFIMQQWYIAKILQKYYNVASSCESK
jgi:hypothetical protein